MRRCPNNTELATRRPDMYQVPENPTARRRQCRPIGHEPVGPEEPRLGGRERRIPDRVGVSLKEVFVAPGAAPRLRRALRSLERVWYDLATHDARGHARLGDGEGRAFRYRASLPTQKEVCVVLACHVPMHNVCAPHASVSVVCTSGAAKSMEAVEVVWCSIIFCDGCYGSLRVYAGCLDSLGSGIAVIRRAVVAGGQQFQACFGKGTQVVVGCLCDDIEGREGFLDIVKKFSLVF